MKNEVKVVDKELEEIKGKLKAIGVMLLIFAIIYPFHLGLFPNFMIIIFGFIAVTYFTFKYQERKL